MDVAVAQPEASAASRGDGDEEQAAAGSSGVAAATAGGDEGGGHVDGNNAMPVMVNGWPRWPSVLQRYYAMHTTSNHQCLHVHSNGVCILSVAPTHPMLQPPLKVTGIAYRTHDSKNLMQTEVFGKKKAGAVFLTPRDMVANVELSDGNSVTLYACVRASVIEINQRLIDRPELLGTPEGYLCVMMPKLGEKKSIGEACDEFDRETPLNVESGNAKRKAEGRPVRTEAHRGKKHKGEAKPCWSFQKGHCKFGDSCRFAHVLPNGPAPAATVVCKPEDAAAGSSSADGGGSGAAPTPAEAAVPAAPEISSSQPPETVMKAEPE